MKHALITTVFVASLVASPALTQQSEHEHGHPNDVQNDQSDQHGHGAKMRDSGVMQKYRRQMQELMQQVRCAEDLAERVQLRIEHQKTMDNCLSTMMERCHQHMAIFHNMIERMSARPEIQEHYWGSPRP